MPKVWKFQTQIEPKKFDRYILLKNNYPYSGMNEYLPDVGLSSHLH